MFGGGHITISNSSDHYTIETAPEEIAKYQERLSHFAPSRGDLKRQENLLSLTLEVRGEHFFLHGILSPLWVSE
jgi:hypothetical protein